MEQFQEQQSTDTGVAMSLRLARLTLEAPKALGELRSDDLCPNCKAGRMDYDSLLNLSCAHCGYQLGGCFT